jgi:8-oxo-dGTP pyrophosphatase MutT (NUDIX family)
MGADTMSNDTNDTVTIALFTAAGQVLLLQRNPNEYPGHGDKWELIGGHVRAGELALDAAERETAEETGIVGITLQYAGISLFAVNGQEAANMLYLARLEQELSVVLSQEHQAYHWTPLALALQVRLVHRHSDILREMVKHMP